MVDISYLVFQKICAKKNAMLARNLNCVLIIQEETNCASCFRIVMRVALSNNLEKLCIIFMWKV